MPDEPNRLSKEEREDVKELSAPRAPVIYEVVRRQGEEELRRPVGSLFWSGIGGGVMMLASVIAQGATMMKLPASVPWRQPVGDIAYSLGFIMVILGRVQLFTEQTIVAVLPVMASPGWRKLAIVLRLWAVVFIANMIGTAIAAALSVQGHLMDPGLLASMLEVSDRLRQHAPRDLFLYAIPAGFLIAAVAWIRAGIMSGEFWIVLVITSTIALGDFIHVVAGGAETFLLLFAGRIDAAQAVAGIVAPVLGGNIIGGTLLFALLAHAQVRQEL